MLKKIFKYLLAIVKMPFSVHRLTIEMNTLKDKMETPMVLLGKILAEQNHSKTEKILKNVHLSEFKVFSQWGDDGIIQFLIDQIKITNKIFIEFGVENYKESNTRFLLINNGWNGLIMDGSEKNIAYIKNDPLIYWKYDITAKQAFVNKENINVLIKESGIEGNIGILHIDIDGNDYWVWKDLNVIDPDIVIMEYNSVFGPEKHWTIPYDTNFIREKTHYSWLYFGASISALCDLAEEKGYALIGCNSAGNNAYFVKKEKLANLISVSAKDGYVKSSFRESRDKKGVLNFITEGDRLKELKGMPIYNTVNGEKEVI